MTNSVATDASKVPAQDRKRRLLKGLILGLGLSLIAWELCQFSLVRLGLVHGLNALGSWTLPLVLRFDLDDSAEIQAAVVQVVRQSGQAALPTLEERLSAPEPRRRHFAAELLGVVGYCPGAVPGLCRLADNDPDPRVRQAAIHSLGEVDRDNDHAIRTLVALLKDNDPDIRRTAVASLGAIGPRAVPAVGALIVTLKDPDPRVRQGSAEALEQIGPDARDAIPALTEALSDPELGVRKEAAEALEAIRGSSQ
jgi:HEAT repeat protein